MEYVSLHHSVIHFCTTRLDKFKYLSNHLKKNSYFLGKVAGEFPKTNGNLDIKILDYSLSQHLKPFNNHFLWEWGGRRGDGGTIYSSQWEWLFLPWEWFFYYSLERTETTWYNSGCAEKLKNRGKKKIRLWVEVRINAVILEILH